MAMATAGAFGRGRVCIVSWFHFFGSSYIEFCFNFNVE